MYVLSDLIQLFSETDLIGVYETLEEMQKAAREYDEECEGDWFPIFRHRTEEGKWENLDVRY